MNKKIIKTLDNTIPILLILGSLTWFLLPKIVPGRKILFTNPIDEENIMVVYRDAPPFNAIIKIDRYVIKRININKGTVWSKTFKRPDYKFPSDDLSMVNRVSGFYITGNQEKNGLALLIKHKSIVKLLFLNYSTGKMEKECAIFHANHFNINSVSDNTNIYISSSAAKENNYENIKCINWESGKILWSSTFENSKLVLPMHTDTHLIMHNSLAHINKTLFIRKADGEITEIENYYPGGFIGEEYIYNIIEEEGTFFYGYNPTTGEKRQLFSVKEKLTNNFYKSYFFMVYKKHIIYKTTGEIDKLNAFSTEKLKVIWNIPLDNEYKIKFFHHYLNIADVATSPVHTPPGRFWPLIINSEKEYNLINPVKVIIIDLEEGKITQETRPVINDDHSSAMYYSFRKSGNFYIPINFPSNIRNPEGILVINGISGEMESCFSIVNKNRQNYYRDYTSIGIGNLLPRHIKGDMCFEQSGSRLMVFNIKTGKVLYNKSGAYKFIDRTGEFIERYNLRKRE